MNVENWLLEKTFVFEASHQLEYHDGKCAHLHGHSWKGAIAITGHALIPSGPKFGMVVDFADLSAVAKAITDKLDHTHLNDVLRTSSPTSEVVARWIWYETRRLLQSRGCAGLLDSLIVTLEETCTSRVTYSVRGS